MPQDQSELIIQFKLTAKGDAARRLRRRFWPLALCALVLLVLALPIALPRIVPLLTWLLHRLNGQ
jgi:hypothetical protein